MNLMKMRTLKMKIKLLIFVVVVVFMLNCSLVGCSNQSNEDTFTNNNDLDHVYIEATNRYGVHEFVMPEFQIAEDIVYISDNEKESWREPLIKLLSTLHAYDYTVEYPPSEDIPNGYTAYVQGSDGVGLIDVDGNGVPEVAEWFQDGGTALNSSIALYKLNGTACGGLHTGWFGNIIVFQDEEGHMVNKLDEGGTRYGDWRVYVDEFGASVVFGKYNYGNMITTTEHYVSELCYDNEGNLHFNRDQYYWFRDIDNIYESTSDTRIHIAIDYGYYFKKDYKTQVGVTEVESYLADLVSRYRLVEDSQLIIIEWKDIEGYGTLSQEELAMKMVDLLLSSEQKFLHPNISKLN